MKDIYTSTPLNKTAAIVTDQSGCTSHEGFTLEQQRANLIARRDWCVQQRKLKLKSKQVYDSLGKEIFEIGSKLSVISKELKRRKHKDINLYIIDIVKKRFSKCQWKSIIDEATFLYEKENP